MTEESTMVNRQKRLRKRNDIGEDVGIYGRVFFKQKTAYEIVM